MRHHWSRLFALGAALLLQLAVAHSEGTATNSEPNSFHARFGAGINLGNALEAPKEGAWGVVLREEYFAAIHQAGFQHVRISAR